MAKVKVRVSMLEDPIEVDESEIPHLEGEGILREVIGEPTTGDSTPPDPGAGGAGGSAAEGGDGAGQAGSAPGGRKPRTAQ